MKNNLVLLCALSTLVGVASAQQASSQNSASVSSNNSVSVNQNGANVSSNTNANASGQTSVAQPKHEQHPGGKHSKHNESSNDEKAGSMDGSATLAAGTTVKAVLAKSIDSRKCKPGDEVVATAAEDVKADGKVVVKKGSKLVGHVTEAKAKGEGQANSSVGIMFDHAIAKNGQQIQMNSVIQAIAAGQANAASSMGEDSLGAAGGGSVASTSHSGGGLLGGTGSTVGGATNAVAGVGGNATGAVNSAVGSTANVGTGLSSSLNSSTTGVVGLKDLSVATDAANTTRGSIITSSGKSVHLDSGTQMILRVVQK